MTTNYVTVAQVKNAMRSSYNGADDSLITSQIIPAVSAWVDRYCNRANGGLLSQQYDELYQGSGTHELFLNNTPIQSIQRIATTQLPALSIHNTDSDMGCRALVALTSTPANDINPNSQNTSTGLTLTYIKNAVTTTNSFTWTAYPTIQNLVDAINAAGNNWTATVMGGFGGWSSSDLRATQGAFGARITTCYMWIHWLDLPWYRVENENNGLIYSPMGFHRGPVGWRVQYTAGYTTLPDDMVQALAEMCANAYYARELNSNLQSEGLGPTNYSQYAQKGFDGLSIMSKQTFNQYRIRTVKPFSTW